MTGLTTAATLWASAAVGLSAAYGIYHLAAITALMILAILELHRLPGWAHLSHRARQGGHEDKGILGRREATEPAAPEPSTTPDHSVAPIAAALSGKADDANR